MDIRSLQFARGLSLRLPIAASLTAAGVLLSYWLPALCAVPEAFRHDFQILFVTQCGILRASLASRMFGFLLQAHQRFDAHNYSQMVGLSTGLGAMWLGFARDLGVYSMLVGYAAMTAFNVVSALGAAMWLKVFAPAGSRRP